MRSTALLLRFWRKVHLLVMFNTTLFLSWDMSVNDLTYVISILNYFNILPYPHLSLQSTQSQALLDTFSGPLIIVIALLRVLIYYKNTVDIWIWIYVNNGYCIWTLVATLYSSTMSPILFISLHTSSRHLHSSACLVDYTSVFLALN